MKSLRQLLLIGMILWLPVAGVMAAVMPITGMSAFVATVVANTDISDGAISGANPVTAFNEMASMTDTDISLMPCHRKADGKFCTHCVLCHLTGAIAMREMPVMPSVLPSTVFTSMPSLTYLSYIPDILAPPPRAALA